MDDRFKELMQELGNAISESLSDSDRIAAAVGEIRRAGYDTFIALEATVGFNKRKEADEDEEGNNTNSAGQEADPLLASSYIEDGSIKWTSQDHKFLRSIKIDDPTKDPLSNEEQG